MQSEKSTTIHTIARLILRELRQERNVQQAQIGQLLGKSTSTWSKVETGDTPLTLEHLLTACTACQVWPSTVLSTTQNYMQLLQQHGWYVASHGGPLPKEEDLLSLYADEFYKFVASKAQTPSWRVYPVLQTPWPYPNCCLPLDVFRWALDPAWKEQQLLPAPTILSQNRSF